MSKNIICLAVLCSCLYVGHASSVPHMGDRFKNAVSDAQTQEFLNKHILKAASPKCPNFQTMLKNAQNETQQCAQNGGCSSVKDQFKLCANPVTTLLEDCLPEKSRDMGEFFVDTMVNILQVICTSRRSELFAVFHFCITHPTDDYEKDNRCKLDLQMKLAEYEEDFPTKEEFCRLQSTYRTCLHEQLEEHCGSTKIKRNFFKVFDKIHTTCNTA